MTTQHECCSDDPPTDLRALARACKRRRSSQVHGRFWLFRSLVLPDCFVGVRTRLGQDIAVGTGRAAGNQAVSVNIAAVEQRPRRRQHELEQQVSDYRSHARTMLMTVDVMARMTSSAAIGLT